YEGAAVNLGVLNGPMSLVAYLDARYLIVKVNVESAVAATTEFLKAHGLEQGDGFGGNGRMVWKEDSAENIIAELKEFEVHSKATSCPQRAHRSKRGRPSPASRSSAFSR